MEKNGVIKCQTAQSHVAQVHAISSRSRFACYTCYMVASQGILFSPNLLLSALLSTQTTYLFGATAPKHFCLPLTALSGPCSNKFFFLLLYTSFSHLLRCFLYASDNSVHSFILLMYIYFLDTMSTYIWNCAMQYTKNQLYWSEDL